MRFRSAFASFLFILLAWVLLPALHASAATIQLHGWAWGASNLDSTTNYPAGLGWLSFNCSDVNPDCDPLGTVNEGDYSVTYNTQTGALSGWAWSSTVGWVRFGGLGSSFPVDSSTKSTNATLFSGNVTGWARACLGTDDGGCASNTARAAGDWDGWISLSGAYPGKNNVTLRCLGTCTSFSSYGVSYSDANGFTGWSYGGPDMGWISWSCLNQSSSCNPKGGGAGQYGVWGDIPDKPYVELQAQDSNGNLVPLSNVDSSGLPINMFQSFANDGVTLSWDGSGVSGCHPQDGDSAWQSADLSTVGNTLPVIHPPLGESVYTISCIDADLNIHSSSVTLSVSKDSAANTDVTFSVSLPSQSSGTQKVTLSSPGQVKLRWTATGFDSQTGQCISYIPEDTNAYFGTFSTGDGSPLEGAALSDTTVEQPTYFGVRCSDSQNTMTRFVEADVSSPTWTGSQCTDPLTGAKYDVNSKISRYSKSVAQTSEQCASAKKTFTCIANEIQGYVLWSPFSPYQYTSCTIDPNYHEH